MEKSFVNVLTICSFALVLVGLYLSGRYNYLLFHSLVEGACIIISSGIFVLAWNSRKVTKNNYIVVIGISFLFLAVFLFLHALAYEGMDIFYGFDANLPAQLWIASRWMGAVTFVLAPLLVDRRVDLERLFWGYFLVSLLVLLSIFQWKTFPDCYLEGSGVTFFNRISEIAAAFLYGISIVLLFRKRDGFDGRVLQHLLFAIVFSIFAGLSYILPFSVYGFSEPAGHYFQLLSFFYLYKAVIVIGLKNPYDLLFRNLQQSEQKIRESELKFRTIADCSYDWEAWIGTDDRYIYVSPSCERISGYPPERYYNDPDFLLKIVHPTDRKALIDHRRQHIRNMVDKVEFRFRIITHPGETRWIRHQCYPVFNDKGVWLGRRTTNRDISREHAVQEALQRERDMFLSGPVMTLTWQNREGWPVDQVSGNVTKLLGYTEEDFLSGEVSYLSCIHPDDAELVRSEVEASSEAGSKSFLHQPFRLLTRRGGTLWVMVTTSIVRDDQGSVTHYQGYLVDINEHKRQEKLLLEGTRKLEQLKRFESLKTMAGAIAHRFNNSMAAVKGNLELLAHTLPVSSTEKEMATDGLQAANGAARMGSMMLTYVGQCSLALERGNLVELVRESVAEFSGQVPASVDISFREPSAPLYCSMDRQQMKEVFYSLLSNSVESFEGAAGEIKIRFGRDFFETTAFPVPFQNNGLKSRVYCFCQIRDTGGGISLEDLQHIFEPFFTTKFVGRGLGLSMSVGILRAHQGAITIESDIGIGTMVRILLPASSEPE